MVKKKSLCKKALMVLEFESGANAKKSKKRSCRIHLLPSMTESSSRLISSLRDEFKMGKKIPLLVMRRGIKCDIQKLDSQLLNNIA